MEKDLPPKLDSETLKQLATEQLVEIIIFAGDRYRAVEVQSNRIRICNRET
ncbi:hypothetical protein [Nostoc sp. TCL240-02]|uniref:hypothetical protein n=1 Tax=Nostoc sp. TCL240-02 TaxID=2572090 RepID=UPI00157F8326|nr:hypothetical protein [Nostoc sp. TCL240-02]